jgi:hypothetical protein
MIDTSTSRHRLSLWLIVIGILTTHFLVLRVTALSFVVTCACEMLFLVGYTRYANKPTFTTSLAFLATGIAYSVAIGFVVLMSFPPPKKPTPPILPIDFLLFHTDSNGNPKGSLIDFFGAVFLIFSYILTIVTFAVTASFIALAFLRHHRIAKWIVMANTPWLLLTAWLVLCSIFESLNG